MVEQSMFDTSKVLNLPLSNDDVLKLSIGDIVLINGFLVTGRDKIHKFLFHDRPKKEEIPFDLSGTVLYHCGPIIKKQNGDYKIISAGPTTSMRVEMYEHLLIKKYGLKGIIGKGGMGKKTSAALKKYVCVYFHTIGGAGAYLADRIKRVKDCWKEEEFGIAEAMCLMEVENFPAIVTMDAHGNSLHEDILKKSSMELRRLIKNK